MRSPTLLDGLSLERRHVSAIAVLLITMVGCAQRQPANPETRDSIESTPHDVRVRLASSQVRVLGGTSFVYLEPNGSQTTYYLWGLKEPDIATARDEARQFLTHWFRAADHPEICAEVTHDKHKFAWIVGPIRHRWRVLNLEVARYGLA